MRGLKLYAPYRRRSGDGIVGRLPRTPFEVGSGTFARFAAWRAAGLPTLPPVGA
jgi:hypothetical protein